jgi:hypothetical protein
MCSPEPKATPVTIRPLQARSSHLRESLFPRYGMWTGVRYRMRPRLLYYFRRTTLLVTGTGAPTEFANIEKLPFGAGSLFAPTPFSMLGPYSGGD